MSGAEELVRSKALLHCWSWLLQDMSHWRGQVCQILVQPLGLLTEGVAEGSFKKHHHDAFGMRGRGDGHQWSSVGDFVEFEEELSCNKRHLL